MRAPHQDGACVCCRGGPLSLQPQLGLPGPNEELVKALKILIRIELDRDTAASPTAKDLDLRSERRAELCGDLREVGVASPEPRPRSSPSGWMNHFSGESLGLTHREPLRDHGRQRLKRIRKR